MKQNRIITVNLIFKIIMVAVFYPSYLLILRSMLACARLTYLTNGSIPKFFASPFTYIGFLVMVVMAGLLILSEQQLVVAGYENRHQSKQSLTHIARRGFAGTKHFLNVKNWAGIWMIAMQVIAMNLVLLGNILINVASINSYFMTYWKKYLWLRMGLLILTVVILFLAVKFYYVPNIMFARSCSTKDALGENKELVRKNCGRIFFRIVWYNLAIFFVFAVLFAVVSIGVRLLVGIFDVEHAAVAIYLTVIRHFTTVIHIIMVFVSIPVSDYLVCKDYYRHANVIITDVPEEPKHFHRFCKRVIYLALLLDCFYLYLFLTGNDVQKMDFFEVTKVVAHRGSCKDLPENTMAAFEQAVDDFADMIELDVRQTKDGYFVIMHDENLKRTTGINRKVGEMTQKAICNLYAGREFDPKEKIPNANVPSLEEVLEFAKEKNLRINFELKTAKTDQNYVLSLYSVLSRYDMIDGNVFTSKDYKALEELKTIDEDIRTGYILTVGLGKYLDKLNVDFYSVKAQFVTMSMIYTLHSRNKEIHVWTLNEEDDILKFAGMGVDYIITDNPVLAREVIYSKDTPDMIKNFINFVFER